MLISMYRFLDIVIPVDSPFNRLLFFFIVSPSKIYTALSFLIKKLYFATSFLFQGIIHKLVCFFIQLIFSRYFCSKFRDAKLSPSNFG